MPINKMTYEEKVVAVKRYDYKEYSKSQIARELGVRKSTIQDWIKI